MPFSHPLINPQLQKKARLYTKKRDVISLFQILTSGTYLLLFYLLGISRRVSAVALDFSLPLTLILYVLFLAIPFAVILFPFLYLKDFAIEKKFGLATHNLKSWIFDELKGLAVGFILGYPMLLFLFFLFSKTPRYWWIFGVSGMFLFQIIVAVLFPVLLLPIFFKQKPVEDEALGGRIRALLKKAKIEIRGIYSINLSSKTKKENAALAGLWKTRRVLLGDTLLENRTVEEIEVVLAHEIGHHIKKHFLKLSLLSLATSFTLFFILNICMNMFSGFPDHLSETLTLFPVFILLSGIISFPIRIVANAYTRVKEKEADRIALELTKNRDAFIHVMAGLANSNLTIADPKKLKVFLSYSHPPIGRRIDYAQNF